MSTTGTIDGHTKTGGEQLEYKSKISSGTLLVGESCSEYFQELKLRRKYRYILFKIGEEAIEVESVGDRNKTFEDLKKVLPYTDCRFAIFDHDVKTEDGRQTSKLWFISWLPNNSTPYHKMAYTSAKGKLRDTIPGVFDIQASTMEELEITLGFKKDDEEDEDFDF